MTAKHRAGRFVAQIPGNHSEFHAFFPNELPPQPAIAWTEELRDWERRAIRALGRLSGIVHVLPNQALFLSMYVRKEAVLSSQIEGTQSSLLDLLLFEHEGAPAVPTRDVEEVSRYVRAAYLAVELLQELPLSMRLLRAVHQALLTDGRGGEQTPGEVRTSQNWIGGSKAGNAKFVPPPHHELGRLLGNLEKFIHDEVGKTPTLIKAGIAHAQFETIHPFLDGNGRVGRLLITLILMAERSLDAPIFYPSLYFKQNREEYYERLQRIRTHGEWEKWMLFFVRGLALVAESANVTVKSTMDLFERDKSKLEGLKQRSLANTLRVYEYVKEVAVVSVPEAAKRLGVTQPTVAAAVKVLEEQKILVEVTKKLRDRKYAYDEYIRVIGEERPLA